MTKTKKELLADLVQLYSLSGVLHQLAELCFEKDSEECEKNELPPNTGAWAHAGEALDELSHKCGC